jgi:hypothetical protein
MRTSNASPRGGGRPEAPSKKKSKQAVKVYLTAEEKRQVKESAARTGLSLSGYGRRRLLYKDHPLFEAVLRTDLRMLACALKGIETALSKRISSEDGSSRLTSEQPDSEGICSRIQAVLRSIEKQMRVLEETVGE